MSKYTNSSLATYINLTEHCTSPRNHAIDTITIHCAVGQCTAKQGCDYFATTKRKASANYFVGFDGSIGMSVEEKNRSWCTSSSENDHRAITIEVASDTKHPYAVRDAAYEALIVLVADICKRNRIKRLIWSTDKTDRVKHLNSCNMTIHRDYADTACPGQYLYERMDDIADRVNTLLSEPQICSVCVVCPHCGNPITIELKSIVEAPVAPESPMEHTKTLEEIAREVIQGKWGSGKARKDSLTEAGYDYTAVQKIVNELMK